MSLTETQIQEIIIDYFTSHYKGCETFWKKEVCSYFNQNTRFDLAFCTTHDNWETLKLIGVEIKTDKDSFKRLSSQLIDYLRIFDEVYLVLENKNFPKQVPPLIGFIKIKDGKAVREKFSCIPEQQFTDYQNEFVFKRAIASLDFTIKETNKNTLKYSLEKIWSIRKKFIANSIFGTRVSTEEMFDKTKMAFTIPFNKEEKALLQSILETTISKQETLRGTI